MDRVDRGGEVGRDELVVQAWSWCRFAHRSGGVLARRGRRSELTQFEKLVAETVCVRKPVAIVNTRLIRGGLAPCTHRT